MSRSCQSAIFSNAAPALARTTRARPQICSLDTGLRLHCGMAEAAALLAAERLLGFAYLGALQMPDFKRNFFESGRHDRQRRKVLRVAVALNHLRRHGSHVQPKPLANRGLRFRSQMGRVAHSSGNFSHGHLPRGLPEPFKVAAILGEPVGDFQSKRCDWPGVDAVRAPDLWRLPELQRGAGGLRPGAPGHALRSGREASRSCNALAPCPRYHSR